MVGSESDQAVSQSQFLKYAEDLVQMYELERKRRKELQDAYEGISALVHGMQEGVIITDNELFVRELNIPAAHIFAQKEEEILHQPLASVLGSQDLASRLRDMAAQEQGLQPQTIDFETANGRFVRIAVSGMKNGWHFFLFHDVTSQVRVENLKSDFLSLLSHELRTPLTGILGFAEILIEKYRHADDTELTESLACIKESGKRMLKTVEELLHFATLQGERVEQADEPLHLSQLVTTVFDSLTKLSKIHNVALHLEYDTTIPAIVRGNPAMLKDMLYQLIQNGILFGNPGGSVTVCLQEENQHAHVVIKDNGIGIPPDAMKNVFNSFYQVEECLSRNREGLGLGLPLARLIAEIHGGRILLHSELDKGTTCKVILPHQGRSTILRQQKKSHNSV